MKRPLSTGLMAIYWIALPIVVLAMCGMGWLLVAPNASHTARMGVPLWVSFAISVALVLLIVWRIRTHARARQVAADAADEG